MFTAFQGRLFSYTGTHHHRLGTNYLQIPVNCPYARVRNYQRDGEMCVTDNQGMCTCLCYGWYKPTGRLKKTSSRDDIIMRLNIICTRCCK
ncbi:hypothetical protein DPMN_064838 [Dreissena polymorpha]|uniref:Catalase core domain-containing protein n=1 Tax=Dreissena polymorpha TaxID=45954 RepID=A0A9D4CEJ8_DREPO|nr:hypothetical protein DPMN_064838 [Dreissena polymorpha]